MIISGLSGNEIFCLAQKGFRPHEIVVGNSVNSLGIIGGIGVGVRGFTGGELANVTSLISEGRHLAIERMEKEAAKVDAVGISGVTSGLGAVAGYTEFLSQGTALHGDRLGDKAFSTAASGMELYCHIDAGYRPIKFAMGNVAYALGVGRGLVGSLRTMARGEVKEFSQMYNHIRHLALERLKEEAHGLGANAVVDVKVEILPFGPAIELLMTGTASFHPAIGRLDDPRNVVTSELSGPELWNLAAMGYAPVQLVMATSVVSVGVVGGWGASLRGMARGEIPELTTLIYESRENCLDVLGKEAEKCGAEQIIGNRLAIREMSPGLVEVMALGTAVKRASDRTPASPTLIPQAVIVESGDKGFSRTERPAPAAAHGAAAVSNNPGAQAMRPISAVFGLLILFMCLGTQCLGGLLAAVGGG
jgi:uncharacterized protein YbjQ (UPF0145 family)